MTTLRKSTVSTQVAEHLREKILLGHWQDFLPGRGSLAAELGVSPMTVLRALAHLEQERLVVSQGSGRPRRIVRPESGWKPRRLRIAVLRFEPEDTMLHYVVNFVHQLREAGHQVDYADKTLTGLKMDVNRVARLMEKTGADAWIVISGSNEILEWFIRHSLPCFALFGRRRRLPIASTGPDKVSAMTEATRALVGLGHRRIVMLSRRMRRLPEPGEVERSFFRELAAHDIPPGPYHMPDWEESIGGFHGLLEELFRVTPPTALIIDEAPFFVAAQQFLLKHGLRVPEDVSMVCTDADPAFEWCDPAVSHIRWDSAPLVRRIVRWADNIARGKLDTRQGFTNAEFVEGGTIGPAP